MPSGVDDWMWSNEVIQAGTYFGIHQNFAFFPFVFAFNFFPPKSKITNKTRDVVPSWKWLPFRNSLNILKEILRCNGFFSHRRLVLLTIVIWFTLKTFRTSGYGCGKRLSIFLLHPPSPPPKICRYWFMCTGNLWIRTVHRVIQHSNIRKKQAPFFSRERGATFNVMKLLKKPRRNFTRARFHLKLHENYHIVL